MEYTHITPENGWRHPQPEKPNAEGYLTVSENPDHRMYWHEYGNPNGEPVLFIHGGPGGGTEPRYARFFDPERYRIILFDQRGCGKSVPHISKDIKGGLANNDTSHLIEDIEKLRTDRGISGKMHVFGGSWGSTLAMAYAQAHPENVQVGGLVLRGIFLCNKRDLEYFYQGNAATYDENLPFDQQTFDLEGAYRAYHSDGEYTIPHHLRDPNMKEAYAKAWHHYVTLIPKEERGDMIKAYHDRLNSETLTPEEKLVFARAWSVWEGVTSFLCQATNPEAFERFSNGEFATAFATIENEYFYRALRDQDPALSNLMTPENLDTISKLQPKIVHGAHDQVCGVFNARQLRDELEKRGERFEYEETIAGHSMTEKTNCAVLTRYMDEMPRMWAHAVTQPPAKDSSRYFPEGM